MAYRKPVLFIFITLVSAAAASGCKTAKFKLVFEQQAPVEPSCDNPDLVKTKVVKLEIANIAPSSNPSQNAAAQSNEICQDPGQNVSQNENCCPAEPKPFETKKQEKTAVVEFEQPSLICRIDVKNTDSKEGKEATLKVARLDATIFYSSSKEAHRDSMIGTNLMWDVSHLKTDTLAAGTRFCASEDASCDDGKLVEFQLNQSFIESLQKKVNLSKSFEFGLYQSVHTRDVDSGVSSQITVYFVER